MLDYRYIKIYYRLKAVDLSRQKELDADLKEIHQKEFIGQLTNLDNDGNATEAGNAESMFLLMVLEKFKETRLKFQRFC